MLILYWNFYHNKWLYLPSLFRFLNVYWKPCRTTSVFIRAASHSCVLCPRFTVRGWGTEPGRRTTLWNQSAEWCPAAARKATVALQMPPCFILLCFKCYGSDTRATTTLFVFLQLLVGCVFFLFIYFFLCLMFADLLMALLFWVAKLKKKLLCHMKQRLHFHPFPRPLPSVFVNSVLS